MSGRARLTVVTLGVRDFARSLGFYKALGFERKFRQTGDAVAFIDAGGVVLALWHWELLAQDEALPAGPVSAYRGMSLAWNCETDHEVDEAFARAEAAGATILRQPSATDYGGYRGYFADPDGHVWEVVRAPGFDFTDDGRLILPD
jgi:catechol 2,3-dioxygenase-like lactoylglutathione lyase family enzyme